MFKVVIIDDEALVRIGLKSMINWQEYECEVIGEAANGQTAYDLIVSTKPHIVITDIKMPVMDGLEMIQKLKEKNIKVKYIILSGFDEFNLVRKAMRYGINDYVIKLEMEPDILINIISRLKEEIMLDFKKQDEENRNERYLRTNKYVMREEFFKKVIGSHIKDQKEIQEELDYLKVKLNKYNLICLNIQVSNIRKFNDYEKADINMLEFSVLNIVDEIVNDFFIGYCFKWKVDEYVVIFSEEDNIKLEVIKNKIKDMSERIITMLKQYFNIDVTIGVSNLNKEAKSISEVYVESYKALQQSFYDYREKVIFFNDKTLIESTSKYNIYEIDSLLEYIESNDIEAIGIVFEDIINILNSRTLSKDRAYDFCAKITYLITVAVEKDEMTLQQIFGEDKCIFEKILNLESIDDIVHWLRNIEKGIYKFLFTKLNDQNNKLIVMAKKFIKENVRKTINLQEVASKLNISSGYLSTIFKQVTGISFIDYVTEIRIEEAKKLLKDTNYKIYEIAQMSGYENAYYFSKVFKKVTGMTPREFEMRVS